MSYNQKAGNDVGPGVVSLRRAKRAESLSHGNDLQELGRYMIQSKKINFSLSGKTITHFEGTKHLEKIVPFRIVTSDRAVKKKTSFLLGLFASC